MLPFFIKIWPSLTLVAYVSILNTWLATRLKSRFLTQHGVILKGISGKPGRIEEKSLKQSRDKTQEAWWTNPCRNRWWNAEKCSGRSLGRSSGRIPRQKLGGILMRITRESIKESREEFLTISGVYSSSKNSWTNLCLCAINKFCF